MKWDFEVIYVITENLFLFDLDRIMRRLPYSLLEVNSLVSKFIFEFPNSLGSLHNKCKKISLK